MCQKRSGEVRRTGYLVGGDKRRESSMWGNMRDTKADLIAAQRDC